MGIFPIWFVFASLILLELSTCQQTPPRPPECGQGTKTRYFSNLTAYQGTKASFDPTHHTFEGNNVEFSFEKMDRLLKNTFVSFGSNGIYKLNFSHKQLLVIDDGAFLELFCLHELDLSYNNITSLSEGVFQGLANLRNLSLRYNQLKDLPELKLLYHLNYLDLSFNAITTLKQLPPLPELAVLDFSYNHITKIKTNAFTNLTSLNQLHLNYNLLEEIEPDQWKGLRNLSYLSLAGNQLKSFDTSSVLPFANLTYLNLSSNILTSINTFYLKRYLPKLTSLDLRQNYWRCIDVDIIVKSMADTKVTLASPINCSQVPVVPTTIKRPTVTAASATNRVPEYLRDIKSQNKDIMERNAAIMDTLLDVYYILVFISILLVSFVTVNVLSSYGFCNRINLRYNRQIDGDESERVLLTG